MFRVIEPILLRLVGVAVGSDSGCKYPEVARVAVRTHNRDLPSLNYTQLMSITRVWGIRATKYTFYRKEILLLLEYYRTVIRKIIRYYVLQYTRENSALSPPLNLWALGVCGELWGLSTLCSS